MIALQNRQDELDEANDNKDMTQVLNEDNESKVGKKLSEFTTRKVVILVLVMLFTSPVFSVSTYLEEPDSYNYGLDLLHKIGPRTVAGGELFDNIVDMQTKIATPLIDLYIEPADGKKPMIWRNKNIKIKNLRKGEK